MAKRRQLFHDQGTREKIQASLIITRLTKHVAGKIEMSASQVAAGLGLLRKVIPDLSSVELSGGTTVRVISPTPMTDEEMATAHGVERPADTRH